jgi:elongation factor Tu
MFRMTVQDVFVIRGRGAVATGRVEYGELRVGDRVQINDRSGVKVDAIEVFRKKVDSANVGENVGLLFSKLTKDDLAAGDVITSAGAFLA